tara:strand:- start:1987 stop:2172 length:186 start_codon:yes stop_codon:yes gene_type:complete
MDEGKAKVDVDPQELSKVMKDYKKLKKYMRSTLFEIKTLDGTEDKVAKLLKDYDPNKDSST